MSKHQKIREYRQANGLSCAELARKIGVAETTLRSLENGTRPITAARAKQFEVVTNGEVTRNDLLPELFDKSSSFDVGERAA